MLDGFLYGTVVNWLLFIQLIRVLILLGIGILSINPLSLYMVFEYSDLLL